MLKKLLKYDFRAIFKIWWILAVCIVGLTIVCITVYDVYLSDIHNEIVSTLFFMSLSICPFAAFAFIISPLLLSAVRIHKNLFSDEGYLTFTLPVKLNHIINSKIISTSVMTTASFLVLVLCIFIVQMIHTDNFIEWFMDDILTPFAENPIWIPILIVEILFAILILSALTTLIIFICATTSSIIVKKAKVLAAILIFYFANTIFSSAGTIFASVVAQIISNNLYEKFNYDSIPIACITIFVILIALLLISSLLYILQYFLLDKKLNLS